MPTVIICWQTHASAEQLTTEEPTVVSEEPEKKEIPNLKEPKKEETPRGKEPAKAKKTGAKLKKEPPKGNKDFGIGIGVWFPQSRPALSFGFSTGSPRWTLGTRLSASYISLTSSFDDAAKKSDYADKITTSSALLTDVSLSLPELGLWFDWPVFVSAAPAVRVSYLNTKYKTTVEEPLTFTGVAVTVGAAASAGYRFSLTPALCLDLAAEIHFRLWDGGYTNVSFNEDNTAAVPTFTESELEHILESLQPYVESIAKRTSAGGSLRMVYRF